ncbi:MAG TPA: glutamyl-tRNA reductase [Methanocorpusculum sp.]|nr:glutamyl-tRNA reductase [Methanocorpusculum sp.]HJJ32958.1 glutamyl-tRNA reductase [Methanocorpusculum sp.]
MNTNLAVASFGLSHHSAAEIAEIRFGDEDAFYEAAKSVFPGVCLLQTCGRVEILVHGRASDLSAFLAEKSRSGFSVSEGEEVLLHLGRLAAGTESLIVGEDQILGQMRSALLSAEKHGGADEVISACMNAAVNLGSYVRQNTAISRGAVSMGSAAVTLAEEVLGGLSGKNILVAGGGEMGRLVAKALSEKDLRAIYVTNRTYENAVKIAEDVGGHAMHLDQLYPCIGLSDVVISCTAAPHEIIRAGPLSEVMKDRLWPLDAGPRPILIIDIANPPDVEASCKNIPGVTLCGIDDLKGISDANMKSRLHEAEQAEKIISDYLPELVKIVNRTAAGDALAELYTWAEEIRRREVCRAQKRIAGGADVSSVIEDLTSSITKKLLEDAARAVRKSAENAEPKLAENIISSITGRT